MQKRLLTKPDLNIARALEFARSVEAAALETKGFKDPSSIASASESLQFWRSRCRFCLIEPKLFGVQPIERILLCGRQDHEGQTCKYRQAKCHHCGKIGHISPVCRRGPTKKTLISRIINKSSKTNMVTEDLRDANTDGKLALHALTIIKPSVKPIRVDLEVSGKKPTLDVDTGAAVSILFISIAIYYHIYIVNLLHCKSL